MFCITIAYLLKISLLWYALPGLCRGGLFASLQPIFAKDVRTDSLVIDGEREEVKLASRQGKEHDIWALQFDYIGANTQVETCSTAKWKRSTESYPRATRPKRKRPAGTVDCGNIRVFTVDDSGEKICTR